MTTIQLPDGATLEYLTPVTDGAPCLLRGTIPPGGVVPLHSHADPETFIVLAGTAESYTGDDWHPVTAGEVHHIAAAPEDFLAISDRYGYWNATPEENAAIGITVPAPARP